MSLKRCSHCKLEKTVQDFCRNKRNDDGLNRKCRSCTKEDKRKIREHCREYRRKWYAKNKVHVKKYNQEYKEKNKEAIRAWVRSLPVEHRRRWGNKDKKRIRDKERRRLPENKIKRAKYCSDKYKNDIQYRLTKIVRARIRSKIKKQWKSTSSAILLGCTIKFFKQYPENKFLPTMTWENYGVVWHLDHIIPCASFDLSDPVQQKKCFHYTNYQPLFATTRIIDGITYIGNLNKNRFIIPSTIIHTTQDNYCTSSSAA